jgi:hypothetical protein
MNAFSSEYPEKILIGGCEIRSCRISKYAIGISTGLSFVSDKYDSFMKLTRYLQHGAATILAFVALN